MPEPYYQREGITLYVGDNREVVPALGVAVSAVCTDPPYGLSFMGRDWDHAVPGVHFWEVFSAAMLPGAHLLAFGGTRTQHRLAVAIEDAGFALKDTLMWLHGQGFPKHKSLLKPAFEPIILARKPGPGVLQIDACRIQSAPAKGDGWRPNCYGKNYGYDNEGQFLADVANGPIAERNPDGRWPPNVILDPDAADLLDAMSGERKSGKLSPANDVKDSTGWAGGSRADRVKSTYEANSGPTSRFFPVLPIDDPDTLRFLYCPKASRAERNAGLEGMPERAGLRDGGRFHSGGRTMVDGEWKETGSTPQPKANGHPTVKPLALMRWLLTLVTPPGGIVLDPFAGSGSTLVAAAQLGIRAIGVELSPEYAEIAARRIDHALDERARGVVFGNGTDARRAGIPPSVPQPDFRSVNGRATHLDANQRNGQMSQADKGRWPANVLMDRAAADLLDQMSGERKSGKPQNRFTGGDKFATKYAGGLEQRTGWDTSPSYTDTGGASRFMVVLDDDAPVPDLPPAIQQLSFTGDD